MKRNISVLVMGVEIGARFQIVRRVVVGKRVYVAPTEEVSDARDPNALLVQWGVRISALCMEGARAVKLQTANPAPVPIRITVYYMGVVIVAKRQIAASVLLGLPNIAVPMEEEIDAKLQSASSARKEALTTAYPTEVERGVSCSIVAQEQSIRKVTAQPMAMERNVVNLTAGNAV